MPNFSERLKEIRTENKITQKQLAAALHISERGIQAYELNERKPGLDVLVTLADYFNVSLDYLAGRTDNPKMQ